MPKPCIQITGSKERFLIFFSLTPPPLRNFFCNVANFFWFWPFLGPLWRLLERSWASFVDLLTLLDRFGSVRTALAPILDAFGPISSALRPILVHFRLFFDRFWGPKLTQKLQNMMCLLHGIQIGKTSKNHSKT